MNVMKDSENDDRKADRARPPIRQKTLFPSKDGAGSAPGDTPEACNVVEVGKRRDGRKRYWCLRHRADATAKYGKPAKACRAAHIPALRPEEIFELDIDKYKGGVSLWGAALAVYDTTRLAPETGIHVHARKQVDGNKELDRSHRAVRLMGRRLPKEGILVTEQDAIHFMISTMFGFEMRYMTCAHCDWPHLDTDEYSVRSHRRHLCAACGLYFHDTKRGVGNPIIGVREAYGAGERKTKLSKKTLEIRQADYPNGIQVWGSNAAFLWTRPAAEMEGIHVHVYGRNPNKRVEDETFGRVVIDGIELDPMMVRVLMAQNALPFLKRRVRSMDCPACGEPLFNIGKAACTPAETHVCPDCGEEFPGRSRFRKTVLNPLPRILDRLAKKAVQPPQRHSLDMLAEAR
jgi:transposase-like protein